MERLRPSDGTSDTQSPAQCSQQGLVNRSVQGHTRARVTERAQWFLRGSRCPSCCLVPPCASSLDPDGMISGPVASQAGLDRGSGTSRNMLV